MRAPKITDCLLLYLLSVLCFCADVRATEASTSSGWHVKNAPIRFRVERDDDQSLIPEVSLLDLAPDEKSEAVKKWIDKNRWSEKRLFQGKLCQNCLPAFGSNGFKYDLHRDFAQFVSRAGIYDSTDPNTVVVFEVYADERRIFRSDPVTRSNPMVEINAGIPPRSKQLKLVVLTQEDRFRNRARWIDPGFILRGRYPMVSFARIYAPGYDLTAFQPEVVATASGERFKSFVLSAAPGEAIEILFESPVGNPSYLVYLVPKDRRAKPSSSWEPQAGLVLETRWSGRALKSSDRLEEFKTTFDRAEPVGRSLVDDIQQTFPIHVLPDHDDGARSNKGGFGFYRYTGFVHVPKKGSYSFATISQWDSYITVDDQVVVSWPGQHNINAGRRGEKKGTVSLEPGIHRLEYSNYSPWGQMFALAAWEKPGEDLRAMTRTDFVPVGCYEAASADLQDPDRAYAGFEWRVIDDFRLEQVGPSFVAMRFRALRASPLVKHACRWTFDDGTVAEGENVDHVFLRPGLRNVQFEVRLEDELLARAAQEVYVHPAWDKCLTGVSNIEPFDEAIRQRNLDKVPPDDLVNLFGLAEDAGRPDWKSLATTALAANLDRLAEQSGDTDFIFEFGRYLQSPQLKQYDKALELFARFAQKTSVGKPIQQRAAVSQAEVLLNYFGRSNEALKILNQLQIDNASRDDLTRRALMAKAQALLALGQAKQAIDLVLPLAASSNPADKAKQRIKHAGLIRHARVLAQSTNDPNQLDYAMADIEMVMAEDAAQVFSPGVNLVKLEVHLARGEFRAAFYLTERLKNLQLSDFDLAEVLARQVIASCGLKDTETAKSIYARLSKDYPSSPATGQAKQALLHALGQ